MAAGRIPPRFGRRFFLIDPLDGTKEFINKRDDFTVNIALIENGIPVVGIVYAPAKGVCMRPAGKGGMSYWLRSDDKPGDRQRIEDRGHAATSRPWWQAARIGRPRPKTILREGHEVRPSRSAPR